MGQRLRSGLSLSARLALLFALLALPAAGALGAPPDVPHGYIDGRPDAKYGTYSTRVQPQARQYQDRLLELENRAYGLSGVASEDPADQSEQIFLLENKIVRLNLDIANAPPGSLSAFERESLLFGTAHAYQAVRHHAERLYENMIRYIDQQIPGPNGQQIRTDRKEAEKSTYASNYRSDQDLSPAEQNALYQKQLQAFLAKGGSLDEIKTLTPELLKKMGPYTRVEYAWLADGTIKVTEGKAGHILLAGGAPVKSSGQIAFVKNNEGEFTMLIVSNSSGSYKPDLFSASKFAQVLERKTGIPRDLVVLTKGEPLGSQGIKVYMKGQGMGGDEISKRVEAAEKQAHEILFPKPLDSELCGSVFGD